jgi:hypothetical protein
MAPQDKPKMMNIEKDLEPDFAKNEHLPFNNNINIPSANNESM